MVSHFHNNLQFRRGYKWSNLVCKSDWTYWKTTNFTYLDVWIQGIFFNFHSWHNYSLIEVWMAFKSFFLRVDAQNSRRIQISRFLLTDWYFYSKTKISGTRRNKIKATSILKLAEIKQLRNVSKASKNSTQKSPAKFPEKMPLKSLPKLSEKSPLNSPKKSSQKLLPILPKQSPKKSPQKSPRKSPQKSPRKSTRKSSHQLPAKPLRSKGNSRALWPCLWS